MPSFGQLKRNSNKYDPDQETLDKIAHLLAWNPRRRPWKNVGRYEQHSGVCWEINPKLITTGVEPLTTMTHEVNATREDNVKELLTMRKHSKLAPKRDADFFEYQRF